MLTRSRISIVIFTKFLYTVGLQGEPPFLSFFDSVQFQSPPTIRVVISDLSIKREFSSRMKFTYCVWLLGAYILQKDHFRPLEVGLIKIILPSASLDVKVTFSFTAQLIKIQTPLL